MATAIDELEMQLGIPMRDGAYLVEHLAGQHRIVGGAQ